MCTKNKFSYSEVGCTYALRCLGICHLVRTFDVNNQQTVATSTYILLLLHFIIIIITHQMAIDSKVVVKCQIVHSLCY